MKPSSKVKRQRSLQALQNPVGVRKSKPKKTELKKKVWFNLNTNIVSSMNVTHKKHRSKLPDIGQYNAVLRSKSQSNMGMSNLDHEALKKSFSSISTSLRSGVSANHLSRKSSDYPVSIHDNNCLVNDFFKLYRNVPKKGILKNKHINHHVSESILDCRQLMERIFDVNFKTSENVLADLSQSIISDSMTKLCTYPKCSFKTTSNYELELGQFDDLTSSVKKLHISHFPSSDANQNVKKYFLLDSNFQHSDLCNKLYDDSNSANKSFAENYMSMGSYKFFVPSPWHNTNNSAETSEEDIPSNESYNNDQHANTFLAHGDNFQPSISYCGHSKNTSNLKNSDIVISDLSIMNSNIIQNCNTTGSLCYVKSSFVSKSKTNLKMCTECDRRTPQQCISCCFPFGSVHHQISEDICHQSEAIHCPVTNCDLRFTDQEYFNKHIITMKHSPCNPLKTLVNGALPSSHGFLCPLCGHSFLDENSCLQHMIAQKHSVLQAPVPFLVFTCPQCLSFFPTYNLTLQHMDNRNHHNTAFCFLEDRINLGKTSPIPVPCKIMSELISRCDQVRFKLFCHNCYQYLHSLEQLQLHINRQHIVQSECEQTVIDVFSSLLTDQSCAECRQFIYTDLSQAQLCIHIDCPLQGPVLSIKARSLKEFILRCGITDVNVVTENNLDLEPRVASSNSDTLILKNFLSHEKLLRHRSVTDELTYSEISSIKKTYKYNISSVTKTSFPYGEGTSKHCIDTDDYFLLKSQSLSKQLNTASAYVVHMLNKPSNMLESNDSCQNTNKVNCGKLWNKNYTAVEKTVVGSATSFFKHKTKVCDCNAVRRELFKMPSELLLSEINVLSPMPLSNLKGNVFDFQECCSNEFSLGSSKTSESIRSHVKMDQCLNCSLKRKNNFSEITGLNKMKKCKIPQHKKLSVESFLDNEFSEGGSKNSDNSADKDDENLNADRNQIQLSSHSSKNRLKSHNPLDQTYLLDVDHQKNKHFIKTKCNFLLKNVNVSVKKNTEQKCINNCPVSTSQCTYSHDLHDEFEDYFSLINKSNSLYNCSFIDNNCQSNCSDDLKTLAMCSSFSDTDLDSLDETQLELLKVLVNLHQSSLNCNFKHSENRSKQYDSLNSKDQYNESKLTVNKNIRSNKKTFQIETLSAPSKKKRFLKRQRTVRSKHFKARKYISLSHNYKIHNQQPTYINLDTARFKHVNNKGIQMHKENVLNNQLTEPCLSLRLDGPLCSASSTSTISGTSANITQFPNLKRIISPQMNHLTLMDRIIFADLENFMFFKFFLGSFQPATYVWGFISARPGSPFNMEQYFYKYPLYLKLKTSHCVHISTEIGTSKDAADFAMCLAIAKLDDRLPTSVPFFIVSRDRGFQEVENQMRDSNRVVKVISPKSNITFEDFTV